MRLMIVFAFLTLVALMFLAVDLMHTFSSLNFLGNHMLKYLKVFKNLSKNSTITIDGLTFNKYLVIFYEQ